MNVRAAVLIWQCWSLVVTLVLNHRLIPEWD